ncbi:MAG: hypothetical protein KAZ36_00990, partial [Bacteroidales bacterium]|nr:hypothetical protein [Bacteroidales bacterium]
LLPLFYHGQHSGTVFLSDHNFLPAKVGTIMPEKKMLVAVGIQFAGGGFVQPMSTLSFSDSFSLFF